MHFLQIVSSVRRRFRRENQSQRRRQQELQEPPDLRRWSDFENPFPSVSPGGYRRYYETHGATLDPEPAPLPTPVIVSSPLPKQTILKPIEDTGEQTTPHPRLHLSVGSSYTIYPQLPPSTSSSPSSTSSSSHQSDIQFLPPPGPPSPSLLPPSPTRWKGKEKEFPRLSTIIEAPTPRASVHRLVPPSRQITTLPSALSSIQPRFRLRRRQRRLLRNQSISKEALDWAPAVTLVSTLDSLDGEGYLWLSSEASESYNGSTPPTTVGHELEDEDEVGCAMQQSLELERTESMTSFHSARSHFSEFELLDGIY